MARYYMFTQVYFNTKGKSLELHFNEWLREQSQSWPSDAEAFLDHTDFTVMTAMRDSNSPHALAITERKYYPMVFETREHLSQEERTRFELLVPTLQDEVGSDRILVSRAAKDSHRLRESQVLVRRFDGELEPMEQASHFIRHLKRIDRYRIYTPPGIKDEVTARINELT